MDLSQRKDVPIMKKWLPILLILTLLCGCGTDPAADPTESGSAAHPAVTDPVYPEIPYVSRFDTETVISLSDDSISVGNLSIDAANTADGGVYISHDIIYYEDRDAYDSGNPYGEGSDADKHSADEAAAHTVVNITLPGAYRITGKLSAGQIRIDLGEEARDDENAVVELILDNADITCTVAPAILFLNVYECDGDWSVDTAGSTVDTSAAGANLILEGENTVSGAYVAKIYKDKEGEKKLWKQDGALYSYMSLNVYGPGTLDLTAENEGLDSELHLTVNGGNINIRSGNDGINTNEDGVSVTTINAGTLHIIAGLGEEGDGIDSNGYLVINGGTVVASANPAADAGLDSDLGSYINGGTVVALGSTMDWAESDSEQVTMNLQFADFRNSTDSIAITYPDGTLVFAYDPSRDEVLGDNTRRYQGAIISSPNLRVGQGYHVYLGSTVEGNEVGGIYQASTVTAFTGGTQMMYTGSDVGMGGMGGPMPGGQMPEGIAPPEDFTRPEGDFQIPEQPSMPDNVPAGMEGQPPEGRDPNSDGGRIRPGGTPGDNQAPGAGNTLFYISDKVNAFSGITAAN